MGDAMGSTVANAGSIRVSRGAAGSMCVSRGAAHHTPADYTAAAMQPATSTDTATTLKLVVVWLTVGAVELVFAWQALSRPLPWQVSLELVALVVLGLSQARLAPPGWGRSTLWAGLCATASMAVFLGPAGWGRLFYTVGLVGVLVVAVRAVHKLATPGLLVGIVVAALGSVHARVQMLAHTGGTEGMVAAGADDPLRRALTELRAPLTRPSLPRPAFPPGSDGPPLVIISVDTLRADAALSMDSTRRLAARGALWPDVMSTSSWTVPAVASLLTGQTVQQHGAAINADNRYQGLSKRATPLAVDLAGAGYRTAAFVSNAWLTPSLGFDRGFQRYLHADRNFQHRLLIAGVPRRLPAADAETLVDRAIDWLDGAPARGFFLWVHLVDPHLPYTHAEPGSFASTLSDQRLRSGLPMTDSGKQKVRDAYAAEVAWADQHIGRLLDALQDHGILDSGAVALTADHGEELWEHGFTGHGHQHHGELTDVALAMVGPGLAPGLRSDPVSLADIAPTLRHLAGLPTDGVDLRQPQPADRVRTAWGNAFYAAHHRSGRQGSLRLIDEGTGPRCYDLAADPGEQVALPCAPGPLVDAVAGLAPPASGDIAELDVQRLEALGYITE